MTVNLSKAKAHLGKYVTLASTGEVITICERNKPLAELGPARVTFLPRKLKLGTAKGIRVPDDFNSPIPEFERAFYGQNANSKAK